MYDSFDKEGENRRYDNLNFPQLDTKVKFGSVKFEVSIIFPNLEVFKNVIKDYTMFKVRYVKLAKNDKVRCKATYREPCLWKFLCS